MYNETTRPMSKSAYEFINLEYMEMMSDGDESMKKVMLEMLIAELPEELQKMSTHVADANWEELSSVSHKMKSTLAFVGNDSMTNANKEIELSTKSNSDITKIPALMEVLEKVSPSVLEELRKEMSQL